MYDDTSHRGRKHFRCYCLQAFSTEEILKRHNKDCVNIIGKQWILMSKKGKYVRPKLLEKNKVTIFDLS